MCVTANASSAIYESYLPFQNGFLIAKAFLRFKAFYFLPSFWYSLLKLEDWSKSPIKLRTWRVSMKERYWCAVKSGNKDKFQNAGVASIYYGLILFFKCSLQIQI